MRIDLAIDWSYGKGGEWKVVKAQLLPDLAPHLAGVATWAISKDPEGYSGYVVHNIETGCRMNKTYGTKAEVIKAAKTKLATVSVRNIIGRYKAVAHLSRSSN